MTHAIKQIVDTDGEPMMEVVVNSDCSAVDMEAIHAEALEFNNAYNTLYVYAPGDAAREVWNQMTPIEQTVSVELRHAEALEMNLFEDRIAAAGKLMFKHGEESAIEACHAEALELNDEIDDGKTMDMYHKWNTAPTAQIRRDMLAAAHSEALVMNEGIELSLRIISAMGGSEGAGDAAGACLYRDDFNEINCLVSVALSLYARIEKAHADALEMNEALDAEFARIDELAPDDNAKAIFKAIASKYEVGCMMGVNAAHAEALKMNARYA
ncbi:TPA: hypothetical protein ACOEHG_000893 [Enterobacter ludwigii]|uniref:hypothetical protein n=1 Tax=Enterobacter ludwigii TaxID=299767 RepID=UPI003B62A554